MWYPSCHESRTVRNWWYIKSRERVEITVGSCALYNVTNIHERHPGVPRAEVLIRNMLQIDQAWIKFPLGIFQFSCLKSLTSLGQFRNRWPGPFHFVVEGKQTVDLRRNIQNWIRARDMASDPAAQLSHFSCSEIFFFLILRENFS